MFAADRIAFAASVAPRDVMTMSALYVTPHHYAVVQYRRAGSAAGFADETARGESGLAFAMLRCAIVIMRFW